MDYDQLWHYVGIYMSLFLTGIGLPPLPEELPVIAAGVLTRSGQVAWWLAWPACILGIVSADMILYVLGRFWGQRLFQLRWIQKFLPPERREHIEDGFHRHGVKILLTARLLPGVRAGIFMTAGAMRYPFPRFLIADGVYAIPGTGMIFFASFFLADTVYRLVNEVHKVQYWLLIVLIVGVGGYLAYRYFRFSRERAAADDFGPPTIPELASKIIHKEGKPHPPEPTSPLSRDVADQS